MNKKRFGTIVGTALAAVSGAVGYSHPIALVFNLGASVLNAVKDTSGDGFVAGMIEGASLSVGQGANGGYNVPIR